MRVKEKFPFVTQSYSDNERDSWLIDTNFKMVDEEYWRFYEGEFWTCGKMLEKPLRVSKDSRHQICCMSFEK